MDEETARVRVLDAAEELFYSRGVQAVSMDELRSAAGVSLKRLYQLFPAKEAVVEAYLRRRDTQWLARLARYVETGDGRAPSPGTARSPGSDDRILAVFDWLYEWFSEPGFRGCAFVNSFGELGATSPVVAAVARDHKAAFHRYLAGLVAAAGRPAALADHLMLLAEGAISVAAVSGRADAAREARAAARLLLQTHDADPARSAAAPAA